MLPIGTPRCGRRDSQETLHVDPSTRAATHVAVVFPPAEARQALGTRSVAPMLTDFDALMQAHLARIFGERDTNRRLDALKELYAEDATLFEPHAEATGHEAISDAVGALQATLSPGFVFAAAGLAVGHSGVVLLRWCAGPPDGPAAVTGTDVAHVESGKIKTLHVFLDPAPH